MNSRRPVLGVRCVVGMTVLALPPDARDRYREEFRGAHGLIDQFLQAGSLFRIDQFLQAGSLFRGSEGTPSWCARDVASTMMGRLIPVRADYGPPVSAVGAG